MHFLEEASLSMIVQPLPHGINARPIIGKMRHLLRTHMRTNTFMKAAFLIHSHTKAATRKAPSIDKQNLSL
jgi:hypothetical protein